MGRAQGRGLRGQEKEEQEQTWTIATLHVNFSHQTRNSSPTITLIPLPLNSIAHSGVSKVRERNFMQKNAKKTFQGGVNKSKTLEMEAG